MRLEPLTVPVLLLLAIGCRPSIGSEPDLQPHPEAPRSGVETVTVPDSPHAELTARLAPIGEAIENVRRLLRPDSGSAAADSTFLCSRRELDTRVREVVAGFDNPAFQAEVWPEGAAAMARWRAEQRSERRATAAEEARADTLLAILRAGGVHATRGEGDTHFAVDWATLLDRLGPSLTPALAELLAMQAEEQRRPTASDGALMISLDELALRIRAAELHLERHPGSAATSFVESGFRRHLAIYLAGLPNTPVFEWRTGELEPRWRDHWERYVVEHGETGSGAAVARHLALLESHGFRRSPVVDRALAELWARLVHGSERGH
jgi:hypothetical protein